MPGRIGELLSEQQRMDLIEYIKVMGNPDFDEKLQGDPLNWDNYSMPPTDEQLKLSCQRSHQQHVASTTVNQHTIRGGGK